MINIPVMKRKKQNKVPKMFNIKTHQFSLEGKWISTYDSIMDASRATGINNGNIYKCAEEQRYTAGGFIWEYV